jgi:hypothetical protein
VRKVGASAEVPAEAPYLIGNRGTPYTNAYATHTQTRRWSRRRSIVIAFPISDLAGCLADVLTLPKFPHVGSRVVYLVRAKGSEVATQVMAAERIDEEDRRGRHECYNATARAAGFIKDAFDREQADRKPAA